MRITTRLSIVYLIVRLSRRRWTTGRDWKAFTWCVLHLCFCLSCNASWESWWTWNGALSGITTIRTKLFGPFSRMEGYNFSMSYRFLTLPFIFRFLVACLQTGQFRSHLSGKNHVVSFLWKLQSMPAVKCGRAIAHKNINFSVWLSDLTKSPDMHSFFAKYNCAYLLLTKIFLDASWYNSTNILICASIWGKRHLSLSKLLPYKKKGFKGFYVR